jgi:hypothetical protein
MRLGYQQQRVPPWRQEDDWHASGGDAGDAFETDAFFPRGLRTPSGPSGDRKAARQPMHIDWVKFG